MIKKISRLVAGAVFGVLPYAPTLGADAGKTLHQQHCIACHARITEGAPASLYTRENRLVTSLDGLQAQVRRCEQNLELRWFDDEVKSVVDYLNRTYYHFQ